MRSRNDRRRSNYGRDDYRGEIYSNRDDVYRTNAREYRGYDHYREVNVDEDDRSGHRGPSYEREGLRRGRLRRARTYRNTSERSGDRIHDAWDRFSNHDDRSYEWEYDNARLEREYGEGTRSGYGYSRYPAVEYGDYRSGPSDDMENYEDVRRRAYNDTRHDEGGGYSDIRRGERNLDRSRRPRSRRRNRSHQR